MEALSLIIDPTEDSPKVHIDPQDGIMEITGVSMPENSFEFYDPIEKQALELLKEKENVQLTISLRYINSMSSKQLLKMIKLMASGHPKLSVTWNYLHDDTIIQMKGEDIQRLCPNVNIQVVEAKF